MVTITVILFAVLLGYLTLRYDRFGQEPWYLLTLTLLLGIASAWFVGRAEDVVLEGVSHAHFALHAATAAFLEEFVKLAAVVSIAVVFSKHFDDPIDGLVYGSYFGIGCALFEMATYYPGWEQLQGPAAIQFLGREVIRLTLHWLTGGLVGFGVGMTRLALPKAKRMLIGWSSSAVGIHFCWDFFCGLPSQSGSGWVTQRAIAVGLMLAAIALYGWAVCIGEQHARHMYGAVKKQLWGWPFSLLASPPQASGEWTAEA